MRGEEIVLMQVGGEGLSLCRVRGGEGVGEHWKEPGENKIMEKIEHRLILEWILKTRKKMLPFSFGF